MICELLLILVTSKPYIVAWFMLFWGFHCCYLMVDLKYDCAKSIVVITVVLLGETGVAYSDVGVVVIGKKMFFKCFASIWEVFGMVKSYGLWWIQIMECRCRWLARVGRWPMYACNSSLQPPHRHCLVVDYEIMRFWALFV